MTLTYSFITKELPNQIEEYLKAKEEVIVEANVPDMDRWVSQVLIVLDFACKNWSDRFNPYREQWELAIGKKWNVKRGVVTWV